MEILLSLKTQHIHTLVLASGQTQPQTPHVNMDLKGKTDNCLYKMCITVLLELELKQDILECGNQFDIWYLKPRLKSHSVVRVSEEICMDIRNSHGCETEFSYGLRNYQKEKIFNIECSGYGREEDYQVNLTDCHFWLVCFIYFSS